ncbi:hypothetical protein DL96DRAFT_1614899 [Flagelloscypha sp. PMI_526]|nr:hypothetical protein DL96DRAFT_1614899 [Flagelloscypha sp. PMI_526]
MMASSSSSIWTQLPPELSREILEWAAVDYVTPFKAPNLEKWNLTLVSHAVQEWVDLYLFRRVWTHSGMRFKVFHLVTQTRTPRLRKILSHVRILVLRTHIGYTVRLEKLLLLFPKLVSLCALNDLVLVRSPHPTLRQIYAGPSPSWNLSGTLGQSLLNITHPDLRFLQKKEDFDLIGPPSNRLRSLYGLSHLCLSLGNWHCLEDTVHYLNILDSTALPETLLICLIDLPDNIYFRESHVGPFPAVTRFLETYSEGTFDDRLLICTYHASNPPKWVLIADFDAAFGFCNGDEELIWERGLELG